MISLRPTNVRARLTLWYVSMLAGLLVLAFAGTCALLFDEMINQLYRFDIEEIETVEGLLFFAPDGTLRLRENYHNHPVSSDGIESFLQVQSPDGAVLLRNKNLAGRTLGGPPLKGEGVGHYSERSDQLSDGTPVRVVSRSYRIDGRRVLMRLAHDEEPLLSLFRELLVDSLFVLPLTLLAAGVAGYLLARRALSPIDQMVAHARRITAARLSERLPNQDVDDELGRLARVFNDMLARLEQAFDQLRRFTSDCSHELRTPLAMIRSVGEVGLQKDGTREEYRDIVGSMLEEVNRLTSLVDSLLTVSRADSGHLQLQRTPVAVMAVAREAAGLFEVLMEENSLRLVLEGDEEAEVSGDCLFLRQALVNIIHNAVKFSPAGETVSVRVRNGDGSQVTVEIQDHGPGIPPEDQDRVFERFYRVDKARGRKSGGAGLGLSIAKWAVEAHGGSIGLDSVSGQGCTFRITLPRLHRPDGASCKS
jgi:heavy metal sensor kinase